MKAKTVENKKKQEKAQSTQKPNEIFFPED